MFENRKNAGEELTEELRHYQHAKDSLVLAIPRGGVEVGYYIASRLEIELSLVISRKLGYPDHPEAAFGAIAEDGSVYLNSGARSNLTETSIQKVIKKEKAEIRRRIKTYRDGKSLPPIKGRTVILVDDGIATRATLFAALKLCRNKEAGKIVVAAPVSSSSTYEFLAQEVDEVVILETPDYFFAVSQVYRHFPSLSDKEVKRFMDRAAAIPKH